MKYVGSLELGTRHSSKCKQLSRSNLKIVDNPLPHDKEVNLCIIRIFLVCLVVHSEQKKKRKKVQKNVGRL